MSWQMGALAAQDEYKPVVGNWDNTLGPRKEPTKAERWKRINDQLGGILAPDANMNFGTASTVGEAPVTEEYRDQSPTEPWEFGLAAVPYVGGAAKKIGALAAGIYGSYNREAEAGRLRGIRPRPANVAMGDLADTAKYGIGHNGGPPLETVWPDVPVPPQRSWVADLPKPRPAARSTEIPNIRGLPVDEAIEIARRQPHLIKSGDLAEGVYVGGPRTLQSKTALNKTRADFDKYVEADPRGGDWYDRYRAAANEITGGDPVQNLWQARQHGQWSAGVAPETEIAFVLRENNSAIAGTPQRAYRGREHDALQRAIASKDPDKFILGDKTAEYALKTNPNQMLPPGATGVNDFRHLRNFGYTEKSGAPQTGSPGDAAHRFMDMETALAVDRANKSNLGGRSDWTGEQLQAAPWVRQKALDIQERGGKNEDGSFKLSYEQAFARANTTIADFFDKHTYFATHEAQPGFDVPGHMSRSHLATPAERQEYFDAPGSKWNTAPGNRDAIYSGLGIEGTGVNMRVRPSTDMQGMYRRPDGTLETNPGQTARPLGAFEVGEKPPKEFIGPSIPEPFKRTPEHMRTLLNAGETLRAGVDAQNAGSWHKLWFGGPAGESNSLFYPRSGKAALGDLFSIEGSGKPHGLGDVVDSGQGITSTSFWPPPQGGKDFDKAYRRGDFDQHGESFRARLDSDLVDLVKQWKQGEGSGAVTQKIIDAIDVNPRMAAAFNDNPHIADVVRDKMTRDANWAGRWGIPRQDVQNLREIVSSGRGWFDRLKAARAAGTISLPAIAGLYAATAQELQELQEGESRAGQR